MKWEIRLSEASETDIADVLAWTLDQFGRRQHDEYRELIRSALGRLGENRLTCIPDPAPICIPLRERSI